MKDKKSVIVVTALQKKANPLFKKLPDVIKTKEEFKDAATNMKALKVLSKTAKAEQDKLVEPLEKVIVGIKELFKPFIDRVKEEDAATKQKMEDYRVLAEKQIKQLGEKLSAGKIKNVVTVVRKQNEIEVDSNTAMVWTLEEVDASKTPRQYLVPDESAIKEALKAGKKVSGWKWVQKPKIRI